MTDSSFSASDGSFSISTSGNSFFTTPPAYYYYPSYSPQSGRCAYCDGLGHRSRPEACPRVEQIEYYENGDIAAIVFHKPEE